MPQDLTDVDYDDGDLTPEQERLILWRDYFELLMQGIALENGTGNKEHWERWLVETFMWLDVAISDIEADLLHIECGQPEYCRWGDAKDLTKLSGNIDPSKE